MKRVPRPNIRKRRGRAARQWTRTARRRFLRSHRKARAAALLKALLPLQAQLMCDYIRIYEEETERAFGPVTVSTRAMRIPFAINKKETTE